VAGLAEPDVADPEVAEFCCLGVAAEVVHVQPHQLAPTQPEGIRGLEHRGVSERSHEAFAASTADLLDQLVRGVEQALQL
jgi:hypothetical protein